MQAESLRCFRPDWGVGWVLEGPNPEEEHGKISCRAFKGVFCLEVHKSCKDLAYSSGDTSFMAVLFQQQHPESETHEQKHLAHAGWNGSPSYGEYA